MKTTTDSMQTAQTHRRWCPVCRCYQTSTGNVCGPCRPAGVTVVGLEVHINDEIFAVCDTYATRDAVAATLHLMERPR
jgi:hypothetical protein